MATLLAIFQQGVIGLSAAVSRPDWSPKVIHRGTGKDATNGAAADFRTEYRPYDRPTADRAECFIAHGVLSVVSRSC